LEDMVGLYGASGRMAVSDRIAQQCSGRSIA
jgi:hypothetical protein